MTSWVAVAQESDDTGAPIPDGIVIQEVTTAGEITMFLVRQNQEGLPYHSTILSSKANLDMAAAEVWVAAARIAAAHPAAAKAREEHSALVRSRPRSKEAQALLSKTALTHRDLVRLD